MNLFRRAAVLLVMAATVVALVFQGMGLAYSTSDPVAKLAQLIQDSGFSYKQYNDSVWAVNFQGHKVAATAERNSDGPIVLFEVVRKKNTMRVTPEMMHKLLKMNHEFDFVKIYFDKDDDVSVRIDVSPRTLDLTEFKEHIKQIARVSNKVQVELKPFLIP